MSKEKSYMKGRKVRRAKSTPGCRAWFEHEGQGKTSLEKEVKIRRGQKVTSR